MKHVILLLGLAILMSSVTAARATTESCAVVLNTPDGFLALREGPGTQFRIKDKLSPGQTVGITTEDCIWHRRGNVTCSKWIKVRVDDTSGWLGWVRSKYIQPAGSDGGTCDRVTVITTPSPAQPLPGAVKLEEIPEWLQLEILSAAFGGGRPKLTVKDDPGGKVWLHSWLWQEAAAKGRPVEILGRCWSACTMVMTAIPQDHLCFGPEAQLGFHAAWVPETGKPSGIATKWMFDQYPKDIQNWITKRGGVGKMSIGEFWYLTAPELWEMGYRRCED
jgi:hypothetical protein